MKLITILILGLSVGVFGKDSDKKPSLSMLTGMRIEQIYSNPLQALGLCAKSGYKKRTCKDLLKKEMKKFNQGKYTYCRALGRPPKDCLMLKKNLVGLKKTKEQQRKCFLLVKELITKKRYDGVEQYNDKTVLSKEEIEKFIDHKCIDV